MKHHTSDSASGLHSRSLSSVINARSSAALPAPTQSSKSFKSSSTHTIIKTEEGVASATSKFFKPSSAHTTTTKTEETGATSTSKCFRTNLVPPSAYYPASYFPDLRLTGLFSSASLPSSSTSHKVEARNKKLDVKVNEILPISIDTDAEGSLDEDCDLPISIPECPSDVELSSAKTKTHTIKRNTPPASILVPSSSSPMKLTTPLQKVKAEPVVKKKAKRIIVSDSSEEGDDNQVEIVHRVNHQTHRSTTSTKKRIQIADDDDELDDSIIIVPNEPIQHPLTELVLSSSPTRLPPVKRTLKRRMISDDDEEEEKEKKVRPSGRRKIQESDSDDDGDEDWSRNRGGESDDDSRLISEDEALEFFNTCDVGDLPAVTACTMDQAQIIAGLRPFANPHDLKVKLRKQKGVSSNVLSQYQDIMKGYIEVDRVLSKCERQGEELSEIMGHWAGHGSLTTTEEGAIDLVSLTEQSALSKETNRDHPAFQNYLYQQPACIPRGVQLKSYQLLGLNWLNLLYSKKISCILADEMGLGKTAQVVSFLSHLKTIRSPRPHLVVVPASTLENWMREFTNFSSNLIFRQYHGSQSERAELRYQLKSTEDLDVVITTYNVASGAAEDRNFLNKMRFDVCVYDEGHQLKNSQSKRYKDLMRMKANWRLLLTGTPLQNNLQELVSLLSFILPKIFDHAKEDLTTIFKVRSDSQVNLLAQTRITRAKKMMTPFVLRRKKVQVLADLPKKIEKIVYCEMAPKQNAIYQDILRKSKKKLIALGEGVELIDDDDDDENSNGLLGGTSNPLKEHRKKNQDHRVQRPSSSNVLMELRKAANHPMLFRRLYDDRTIGKMAKACMKELEFHDRDVGLILEDMDVMTDFELHLFSKQYKHLREFALQNDEWMDAGKVKLLRQILLDLSGTGSRVLIFSQFTQMLAILEYVLKRLNVKYLLLTGSTSVGDRQPMVDQFTRDESFTVFLLSTRAGGLGLNLMAADTVIIFDQDFNPHNDRQAEDRAYRLGQKRDVKVIKFVTKNTIEEDILQLASNKLALDTSISDTTDISGGGGGGGEKAIKKSLMAALMKRVMEE